MNLFNKYPHPMNFDFADGYHGGIVTISGHPFELHTAEAGGDIHHIGVSNHQVWPGDIHNGMLRLPDGDKNAAMIRIRLEITESAGMHLNTVDGKALLEAKAGGWLGISGKRWLFRFKGRPEMQFYGLGENHTPFERSGRAYWFWNTDVWADHPFESVRDGDYDPDYLSIPYLIVKQNNTYVGLLEDSPFPARMSTAETVIVPLQDVLGLGS